MDPIRRAHARSGVVRVAILTSLAVTSGLIAWLPISEEVLRMEIQRAERLQQVSLIESGRMLGGAALAAAGFPEISGVRIDSVHAGGGGWYLRLSHRLSPRRCEYDAYRRPPHLDC